MGAAISIGASICKTFWSWKPRSAAVCAHLSWMDLILPTRTQVRAILCVTVSPLRQRSVMQRKVRRSPTGWPSIISQSGARHLHMSTTMIFIKMSMRTIKIARRVRPCPKPCPKIYLAYPPAHNAARCPNGALRHLDYRARIFSATDTRSQYIRQDDHAGVAASRCARLMCCASVC